MPNKRLMMLGLDAVSLPFIRDNRDRLPNLAALMAAGHLQELSSSADYLSASVWPTFCAGRPPGHHGQYFPMQWHPKSQRYRRITDPQIKPCVAIRPFWYDLADSGLQVIAFDIGHVLDDTDAPCLQISNWSQQSFGHATASDPEVLRDIISLFGRRPIGPEVPVTKSRTVCRAIQKNLVEAARLKGAAIRHLMDRPWELFVVGMYEAHRAGHNLWPVEADFASDAEPDAMLGVYMETDTQVGLIQRKLREIGGDQTSLAVFSLHGIEQNCAQDHFLPEIVRRLNDVYLGQPQPDNDYLHPRNVMAFLRIALPAPLQYRLAAILGEKVQDEVVNRSLIGGYDWKKTPAFSILSGGEGLIRLNLMGRERDGYFKLGDPEVGRFTDWMCERLREIVVAETGGPLISEVGLAKVIFPGPRSELLPDIILRWGPELPVKSVYSPAIGKISARLGTGRGGNHNNEAFVLADGPEDFIELIRETRDIADLAELVRRMFFPHGNDGQQRYGMTQSPAPARSA